MDQLTLDDIEDIFDTLRESEEINAFRFQSGDTAYNSALYHGLINVIVGRNIKFKVSLEYSGVIVVRI
jgi:hypothetical protein